MPYIPPIQMWDLLEKDRNKNIYPKYTDWDLTLMEEMKIAESRANKNKTIRGKRSEIFLVPDSKEYYRGINLVQWYWYRLVYKIKRLIHKGD